jgi:hypothetical protein
MGYGYWPVENGYIGGLVSPATHQSAVTSLAAETMATGYKDIPFQVKKT